MSLMLSALIAATLGAAQQADALAPHVEAGPGPERLLTVLTTAEPQTQLMAMVLTRASLQQGIEAQVLLCGPAGDLALVEPPEAATAPQAPRGASPHGLLRGLIEAGVRVEVCAIYLPNSPHSEDALLDHVGVAQPPEIAATMIAPTTHLFTF